MEDYVPDPHYDHAYMLIFYRSERTIDDRDTSVLRFRRQPMASNKQMKALERRFEEYLAETGIAAALKRADIDWQFGHELNIRDSSLLCVDITTDEKLATLKLLSNNEVRLVDLHTVLRWRHEDAQRRVGRRAIEFMLTADREIEEAQKRLHKLAQQYPEAWQQYQAQKKLLIG